MRCEESINPSRNRGTATNVLEFKTTHFPSPHAAALLTQAAFNALGHETRLLRAPLPEAEVDRLLKFYEGTRAEGDSFDAGVKLGMQAVLVSPHFLYRGEVQPDPDNPEAIHDIDEFALASRLSYFLWSSMPDERLHELATSGPAGFEVDEGPDLRGPLVLSDKPMAALKKNRR